MCAAIRRSARILRHYAGCIGLFFFCISITSCSRKPVRSANHSTSKPIVAVDEVVIAPLDDNTLAEGDVDIPDVPRPLQGVYDANHSWQAFTNERLSIVAHYTSSSSVIQLVDFYRQHMEFLGWELDADFKGRDDVCFVFRRPSRCCIVSVRASEQGTCLSIMYQSEFNNATI